MCFVLEIFWFNNFVNFYDLSIEYVDINLVNIINKNIKVICYKFMKFREYEIIF